MSKTTISTIDIDSVKLEGSQTAGNAISKCIMQRCLKAENDNV